MAAFIPLAATLAPSIIDLITSLVHHKAPQVEQQLGGGTGPVKFGDVFSYVMASLNAAATAGQIDKQLPSDDLVKLIIQSVVTSMNKFGMLGGTAPIIPMPSPTTGQVTVPGVPGKLVAMLVQQ